MFLTCLSSIAKLKTLFYITPDTAQKFVQNSLTSGLSGSTDATCFAVTHPFRLFNVKNTQTEQTDVCSIIDLIMHP